MVQGRVKIPEQMEQAIRQIISTHPELGYVSTKGFVAHSVLKRIYQIKKTHRTENTAVMISVAPSNEGFTYLPHRYDIEEWW